MINKTYKVRKPLGLVKDAGSGTYKIHFVIFKVHFSFPIPPALGDLILKADAALLKILEHLHRLTTFTKSVK